jgi:hypothetical protein
MEVKIHDGSKEAQEGAVGTVEFYANSTVRACRIAFGSKTQIVCASEIELIGPKEVVKASVEAAKIRRLEIYQSEIRNELSQIEARQNRIKDIEGKITALNIEWPKEQF